MRKIKSNNNLLKTNIKRILFSLLIIGIPALVVGTPMIVIRSGFSPDNQKPSDLSARQVLENAMKECAYKRAREEIPYTFKADDFFPYTFKPENRSCDNSRIEAISSKPESHPNYSVNIHTYIKECSHQGKSKVLGGCSHRTNGNW